jgi:hypothetical protein
MTALPRWLGALVAISWLARPIDARAQSKARAVSATSVSVRVVDGAEDRAYIEPGSAQGLRLGDEVSLAAGKFKIVAISSSFAAVALGGKRLPLGTRGTVSVLAGRSETVALGLPEPTELSRFRDEWRTAALPASQQTPKSVPLGTREQDKNRLIVSDALYGVVPRTGSGTFFGNELKARLHYEPYRETPLALDLDIAMRTFTGDHFSIRPGAAARQVLRVQEMALSYGSSGSFRGELGRLRAASSLVGQLDGVRLEAPLSSGLRLSAYGGALPQAFTGMISDQVARFGGELVYQDVRSGLRPRVLVGAYASRFAGSLDEKKAYASFDLLPAKVRLGGHAELSFFDAGNAWHAKSTELTAAGLDGNVELDVFHFGGRVEMRRPDRSRFLASLLPIEWLCWGDPAEPRGACLPGNASYLWLLDSGAKLGKFSVDLGGQSSYTRGTDASNFGGFANLRWLDLIGKMHVDLGASAFTGSVVRSTRVTFAPGLIFANGNADLSLSYRPALVRYRAALQSSIEHSLGAALWLSPHETLDFNLAGDWIQGTEVSALMVQGVFAWHIWI